MCASENYIDTVEWTQDTFSLTVGWLGWSMRILVQKCYLSPWKEQLACSTLYFSDTIWILFVKLNTWQYLNCRRHIVQSEVEYEGKSVIFGGGNTGWEKLTKIAKIIREGNRKFCLPSNLSAENNLPPLPPHMYCNSVRSYTATRSRRYFDYYGFKTLVKWRLHSIIGREDLLWRIQV
jgi:hypothetical protein